MTVNIIGKWLNENVHSFSLSLPVSCEDSFGRPLKLFLWGKPKVVRQTQLTSASLSRFISLESHSHSWWQNECLGILPRALKSLSDRGTFPLDRYINIQWPRATPSICGSLGPTSLLQVSLEKPVAWLPLESPGRLLNGGPPRVKGSVDDVVWVTETLRGPQCGLWERLT